MSEISGPRQLSGYTHVPIELTFTSDSNSTNAYREAVASVALQAPNGDLSHVPIFWDGDRIFRARICPKQVGRYQFELIPHQSNKIAWSSPAQGEFIIEAYGGENPLMRHGALVAAPATRRLIHTDGAPFLWLADTWWYGATGRCAWPQPFQDLATQRAQQGFSVVQLVVGMPPEVDADHDAIANEGGYPFTRRWDLINPRYFQAVDQRIKFLVDAGIVPCILGGWGFQIDWMGVDQMTRYWQYLVARYAAYPVVWCLCGESDMLKLPNPTPTSRAKNIRSKMANIVRRLPAHHQERLRQLKRRYAQDTRSDAESLIARREAWENVGRAVADYDPEGHIITTHPIPGVYSHESLNKAPWVGMTAIQSGHSEHSRQVMVNAILQASIAAPHLPIVNMEPWYEGILGQFWAVDQRYAFWMCILAGAAGHSYGANGLWQMSDDDGFLGHWGDANWSEAACLPGSYQLGVGASILRSLPWWRLTPRLNALDPHWQAGQEFMPFMAGAEDDFFLVYFPSGARCRTTRWTDPPTGKTLAGVWLNPRTGDRQNAAPFPHADLGGLLLTCPNEDDWLLLLQ